MKVEKQPRPLTLEEIKKTFKDPTERQLALDAFHAGLMVYPGRRITSPHPVQDRNGEVKKTATTPDLFVIDPTELSEHIEVTRGNGNSPHKQAQLRVVAAAGIDNYSLVKGNQAWFLSIIPKHKKRAFFGILFGWIKP